MVIQVRNEVKEIVEQAFEDVGYNVSFIDDAIVLNDFPEDDLDFYEYIIQRLKAGQTMSDNTQEALDILSKAAKAEVNHKLMSAGRSDLSEAVNSATWSLESQARRQASILFDKQFEVAVDGAFTIDHYENSADLRNFLTNLTPSSILLEYSTSDSADLLSALKESWIRGDIRAFEHAFRVEVGERDIRDVLDEIFDEDDHILESVDEFLTMIEIPHYVHRTSNSLVLID